MAFPRDARVETWVETGTEVSAALRSVLAKLIVTAPTAPAALGRCSAALARHAARRHRDQPRLPARRAPPAERSSPAAVYDRAPWPSIADRAATDRGAAAAGPTTTVQDYPGRLGYWDVGVPPSGPMDDLAFRLANRLLGNAEGAAGLEFTAPGPTLRFNADARSA